MRAKMFNVTEPFQTTKANAARIEATFRIFPRPNLRFQAKEIQDIVMLLRATDVTVYAIG